MTQDGSQKKSGPDQRSRQIHDVITACVQARARGEVVSDGSIMDTHADLMPELACELKKLKMIETAQRQAEQETNSAQTTTGGHVQAPSSHSSIQCPNCHNHVQLAPDMSLAAMTCEVCASVIRIASDDPETSPSRLNTRLGRFELIDKVGAGGFGKGCR